MRRLVLLRHGESAWNAEARIQGQQCAGLTVAGHEQAAAAAEALAERYPDGRLVTSDLQRCLETVGPLAAALDHTPEVDERLRERSFGAWEGRLRVEVERDDADRWRRWRAGEDVIEEVGGESSSMLVARVAPVLRSLLAETPEGEVTVVATHGGPIWHATHALLRLAPPAFGGVDNASITELVWWGDVPDEPDGLLLLERWNEVGYLPLRLRTGWRPRVRRRVERSSA